MIRDLYPDMSWRLCQFEYIIIHVHSKLHNIHHIFIIIYIFNTIIIVKVIMSNKLVNKSYYYYFYILNWGFIVRVFVQDREEEEERVCVFGISKPPKNGCRVETTPIKNVPLKSECLLAHAFKSLKIPHPFDLVTMLIQFQKFFCLK